MKFKKLASLALAGAISFSLAAPTFAAGNETEITGTYTAPIIKVIVPPTAAAFINPLGLDVNVINLAIELARSRGKGRVHTETGALVP